MDRSTATEAAIDAKKSSLNRLMTIWGWFFDFFTLLVNLSDVTSDLMVCHQFAIDNEWVWFGLVLGSLFIGNVAFTSFLFIDLDSDQPIYRFLRSLPFFRPVKFLMILPFAQLIPSVAWTLNQIKLWKDRRAVKNDKTYYEPGVASFQRQNTSKIPADWAGNIKMNTGAGTEEVANVVGAFHTMGRLEGAIKEHLKTHIFFYVETVVEAMPQVVIQLLAITFMQKVSPIQVVSMGSSLLSIVSKGYVVASSQTISAVVWKFFCCAADLFGLFYIFSSIMDRSAPQEVALFVPEGPKVTHLTYLFVWKWTTYIGVSAFLGLLLLLFMLIFRRPEFNFKLFKQVLIIVSLGIFLFGPAMIAFEAIKFSVFVVLVTKFEPSYAKAANALLYSYLRTGTLEDKRRKTKNLLFQLTKLNAAHREKMREENLRYYRHARHRMIDEPPPPMEVLMSYWCEETSDEEPSDWEDDMAISAEQKARFQAQAKKHDAIYDCYTRSCYSGTFFVLDLLNSEKHMIPAGTNYDTYLRLYIGGNTARAERIQRRRLLRKGGLYVDAEDNNESESNVPVYDPPAINDNTTPYSPTAAATGVNGSEEETPLITSANLEINNTQNDSKQRKRVTKYPHRLPFTISSIDDIFKPPATTKIEFSRARWKDTKWDNVFLFVLAVLWTLMVVLGQLFSAIFPFVNYPLYLSSQNLLQHVCFIGYASCLFVVIVLLVPVIKYARFCARFQPVRSSFAATTNVANIFNIIENEHLPPVETIVKDFLYSDPQASSSPNKNSQFKRNNVLSPELVSVVASYLQYSDFDLKKVGTKEFRRMKEMHR